MHASNHFRIHTDRVIYNSPAPVDLDWKRNKTLIKVIESVQFRLYIKVERLNLPC